MVYHLISQNSHWTRKCKSKNCIIIIEAYGKDNLLIKVINPITGLNAFFFKIPLTLMMDKDWVSMH